MEERDHVRAIYGNLIHIPATRFLIEPYAPGISPAERAGTSWRTSDTRIHQTRAADTSVILILNRTRD